MNGDKIVPINEANRSKVVMNVQLNKLPTPIKRARERSLELIKSAMQVLFDHVDDALFELADRAATNFEQNLYFESMREIRIHRRQIETEFSDDVDFSFIKLIDPDAELPTDDKADNDTDGASTNSLAENSDDDGLSLLEKDELEEMVAIDTMVNKANSSTEALQTQFTSGLNTLVLVPVTVRNNPISPRKLADNFLQRSRDLTIDIKAKLVLFKLFERHVLGQMVFIFEQSNQILTNAGINTKKASPTSNRGSGNNRSFVPPVRVSDSGGVDEESLLHTLQGLLSSQGELPQQTEQLSKVLFNALSHIQNQQLELPAPLEKPQLLPSAQIERSIGEYSGKDSLDHQSEDVIKLVDMLFEFILEDRNLADPMKALLARLQIPIIKVALADSGFFNKGGHSARRLLNEMATAALGWEDDGRRRDPLYKTISKTIERVLKEFDRNVELFDELLEDFILFIDKERRRTSLLEKRTLDEEDSKAKTEVGRTRVAEELLRICDDTALPPVVDKLLNGPWANVMFIVFMRQGGDSSAWSRAVETASELVWSVKPIKSTEQREKLLSVLPVLLKKLRMGLEGISFNPSEQSSLLTALEQQHLELLKQSSQSSSESEDYTVDTISDTPENIDDVEDLFALSGGARTSDRDRFLEEVDDLINHDDVALDDETIMSAAAAEPEPEPEEQPPAQVPAQSDEPVLENREEDALIIDDSIAGEVIEELVEEPIEKVTKELIDEGEDFLIHDDMDNASETDDSHQPSDLLDEVVETIEPDEPVIIEDPFAETEADTIIMDDEVNEELIADDIVLDDIVLDDNERLKNETALELEPKVEPAAENETIPTLEPIPVPVVDAEPELLHQKTAAIAEDSKPVMTDSEPVVKDPVLAVKDSGSVVDDAESVMNDTELLEKVDRIPPGAWFERKESGATYRCKLATVIKATGKFIFINRNGVKVGEETRETVALLIQSGDLRSLDDGMLFDRALESVITNLRTSRDTKDT